jgi:hypothetical protein
MNIPVGSVYKGPTICKELVRDEQKDRTHKRGVHTEKKEGGRVATYVWLPAKAPKIAQEICVSDLFSYNKKCYS